MDAKNLIMAGRLSEARKLLTEEVKASPTDPAKRTMLFQVLSFCGEWDRAERHLDVIVSRESKSETGVQIYKNILHAEKERSEVAKRLRRPSVFPKSPAYFELYFDALEKLSKNDVDGAAGVFDRISETRPEISGTINGKSFEGFEDTDVSLAFFLEGIVHDRYVWIPVDEIRELIVSEPKTLFDLLWIPAHVTTWEGVSIGCYLNVLYPDSFAHEDDRVKLGRMTDWLKLTGPVAKGFGQHVFQIGEEDVAILEIREVLFNRLAKA
ncbi:MAG: type VI secretion system accessory protein TagJ [Syntrophobacteraceae bacterium]